MTDDLYGLTTPPPIGDPVDRVMRRVARHRRRRASVAVAAVAVLAVAIPITASSFVDQRPQQEPATPTGGLVPFAFRPASIPTTAPSLIETGKGLPACEASDLQVVVGKAGPAPRGGATVEVTATNHGRDCGFRNVEASLRTESGQPVEEEPDTSLVGRFHATQKLARGDALGGTLTWTNWCGADPGTWHVIVSLGTSTAEGIVQNGSASPTCTYPKQGSFIGLDFTPVNHYGQPLADPQRVLRPSLSGPSSAAMGSILKMTLRVTNPSRGPVPLTPCPRYSLEWAQNAGLFSASPQLLLNCPDAPEKIPAGGHVDFALELPITPALASLGKPTTVGTTGTVLVILNTTSEPLPITVLPDEAPVRTGRIECRYGQTRTNDQALTPPAAQVDRATLPRTGVISTTNGDLTVTWNQDAPCSVTALLDTARQGFWDDVPASETSDPDFPTITFRHRKTAGYLMREEIPGGTTYPAGTVLFVDDDNGTHGPDQLQIVLGPVPYTPVFTVVGQVTAGLNRLDGASAGTIAISGIR